MKGFLVILLCPFICCLQNYQCSCSATASPLPGPCSMNNCLATVWKWLSRDTWVGGLSWENSSSRGWGGLPPPMHPQPRWLQEPGEQWTLLPALPLCASPPQPSTRVRRVSESLRLSGIPGDICLLDSLSFPPLIINCPLKSSKTLTALDLLEVPSVNWK